jgi:hypothetical protein
MSKLAKCANKKVMSKLRNGRCECMRIQSKKKDNQQIYGMNTRVRRRACLVRHEPERTSEGLETQHKRRCKCKTNPPNKNVRYQNACSNHLWVLCDEDGAGCGLRLEEIADHAVDHARHGEWRRALEALLSEQLDEELTGLFRVVRGRV